MFKRVVTEVFQLNVAIENRSHTRLRTTEFSVAAREPGSQGISKKSMTYLAADLSQKLYCSQSAEMTLQIS